MRLIYHESAEFFSMATDKPGRNIWDSEKNITRRVTIFDFPREQISTTELRYETSRKGEGHSPRCCVTSQTSKFNIQQAIPRTLKLVDRTRPALFPFPPFFYLHVISRKCVFSPREDLFRRQIISLFLSVC